MNNFVISPGTYEWGLDFQRKAVAPALLEVNGLSDLGVDIDLRYFCAWKMLDAANSA